MRRRIIIALAGIVVVLAGLVVGGLLYLDSQAGRTWLAGMIEDAVNEPGVMELTLGDIGPGLPGSISVAQVSLADRDGVWLELDDVTLDWRIWSLLSRRLDVELLSIASVNVIRAPAGDVQTDTSESADTEPLAAPELPVDIVIGELVVADISLGEALLGNAAKLEVAGTLGATRSGTARFDLKVERIDGVGGSLHALADIDLTENLFELSVEAHEPPDGVLVHLLDLAPYPEFSLSLEGDGPATDWSGVLTASIGDLAAVDLTVSVAAGDTLGLTIDGAVAVANLLPEDLRDVAGPEVGLVADVAFDDGVLRVTRLDVEARALAVSAEGTVGTEDNSVDLKINLTGRDASVLEALAAPVAFGTWQLDLEATGDLEAPDLSINANAQAVDVPDVFSGDLVVTAELSPRSSDIWHAEGHIVAAGAATPIDAAQDLLGNDLNVDFSLEADTEFTSLKDLSLSVTGSNLELTADGDVDLEEFSGQAMVKATIADVAVLSEQIGLPLSGGMSLESDLVLHPNLGRATGSLSVVGNEFAIDDDSVAPFIGTTLSITSDIESDLATALSLTGLTVKTDAVDLTGTLDVTDEFSRLAGRLDGPLVVTQAIANLASIDPVGSADVSVRFAGAVDDPVIRARARLAGVAAEGVSFDGVAVDAELRNVVDVPSGEGLVTLPSPAGDVKIATSFVIETEDIVLPAVVVSGAGVDGRGALRLGGDDVVTGGLGGTVADISALAGLADVEASGAAVFHIDLSPDPQGGQAATVGLQATDVVMFIGEDDPMAVRDIRLTAALTGLDGEPTGNIDVSLGAATYQSYVLDGAVVTANVDGDDIAVDVGAQGDTGLPVSVDMGVDVTMADAATIVVFRRLSGFVSDKPFEQQDNLRVTLTDDGVSVQNLSLTFLGGTIAGHVDQTSEAFDVNIAIADLPLDVVEIVEPQAAFAGVIDAQIDLATEQGVIVGTIDLTASDIDLSEGLDSESEPADIDIKARLGASNVEASIVVGGLPGTEIEANATIGAAIDAQTLSVSNTDTARLDASLSANARLESFWDNLPASDQRMRGTLNVELTAGGVVGDPQIQGQGTLTNGRYEHLVYGTLFEDIALTLTGDSTRELALRLTANDGGTGIINATGQIALGDDSDIEADLSFTDATLVRRDDVTASASGDISYRGTPLLGAITGTVTTNVIEISLVNSLPPSVVVLDVKDAFDDNGNGQQSGGAAIWSATLDLAIDMPRRVFLRGKGLETEWFGNVNIGGTTDNPIIDGKLEIQRGQVSLVGRVFEFTRGTVELDPSELDNPLVDISAESQRQDVKGIITISGRANDPDIEITSVPPYPEAEVLPRVLFGKSASNLTAFEAFELASAVAELSGVGGGGPGIIDRARENLGIDVLRVGSDDEGETVVGAGSYVTERVYVGVEQGTGNQSGAVTVEVEVTDDITVDTSTGADSSANVGVNWRWDY